MNGKGKGTLLLIIPVLVIPLTVSSLPLIFAQNNATEIVNATVKISVCGNEIVESGEDCENGDLQSRTCSSLGYSSGNLACDISCSFDTSPCIPPSIDPTNVSPSEISSLLAAGAFTKPSSDSIISVSSLTAAVAITISVPVSGGASSVFLPQDVNIARSDGNNFDPTALTASAITTSLLSGFSQGVTVDGALQLGISAVPLQFSTPITLSIYVGTSLNGQTLNVVRSTNTDSGWVSDGIVSPATCLVASGSCTFQATKASYFATIGTVTPTQTPTPAPTTTPTSTSTSTTTTSSSSSSNGGSTTTTSSTSTSTQTPSATKAAPKSVLPPPLRPFDLDGDGTIEAVEVFGAVKSWVNEWRAAVLEELTAKEETERAKEVKACDIDRDGRCDLKDLSILLFYVKR